MALSRTAALLLLLPAPAVLYLAASMDDVNANPQCLPSAAAVRQQYPGSWAAWTTHFPDHKGEKCWFPAAHETRARHVEAMLRRAARKLLREQEVREEEAHDAQARKPDKTESSDKPAAAAAPVVLPAETAAGLNALGWTFRAHGVMIAPAMAIDESEKPVSSFNDRFAAVRNVTSVEKPSIIQRMMDPVGAIPDIP